MGGGKEYHEANFRHTSAKYTGIPLYGVLMFDYMVFSNNFNKSASKLCKANLIRNPGNHQTQNIQALSLFEKVYFSLMMQNNVSMEEEH